MSYDEIAEACLELDNFALTYDYPEEVKEAIVEYAAGRWTPKADAVKRSDRARAQHYKALAMLKELGGAAYNLLAAEGFYNELTIPEEEGEALGTEKLECYTYAPDTIATQKQVRREAFMHFLALNGVSKHNISNILANLNTL